MEETKIDKLRQELTELRKERDKIIFEKGMAANENKDLRENSAYDYWFEKEDISPKKKTNPKNSKKGNWQKDRI